MAAYLLPKVEQRQSGFCIFDLAVQAEQGDDPAIARAAKPGTRDDALHFDKLEDSSMPEAKTKPTDASVQDYLASRANPDQLRDCNALMGLMERVTRQPPRMWGPSIVGYGRFHYRYGSGRTGESCLTGFAVRGKELVVYLVSGGPEQESLLPKLGKHKMGKSCLYFKRLADLDVQVLEALVTASVAETVRRHGAAGTAP